MAGLNKQNVQESSKRPARASRATRLPKADVRYWQDVLFQPSYTRAGETFRVADWAVKIQHRGRRETFNLGTPNKAAAASRAKEIYLSLQGAGWDQTLSKFKPGIARSMEPAGVATVGQFIDAATTSASGRAETFEGYAKALRKIVGDISGIDGGKSKYDYAGGGRQKWLDQINSVSLSSLTPERVQQWKLDFIRAAGQSLSKQRKARNSANAFLRNARSLFSKKLLKFVLVKMPDPLPFAEVQFEPRSSMRYRSEVDAAALVGMAQTELSTEHPEQYKIFLLAIMAGLRRREIDTLEWSAIHFDRGLIQIRATKYYQLKNEDSAGDIEIDPEVVQTLKAFSRSTKGIFVIQSENLPRMGATYRHYRCQKDFAALVSWLRLKGVSSGKPLHEMRKEFGSLLCERGGIYEASRALRHADIRTTSAHYLDRKRRLTVGLGNLLKSQSDHLE